MGNNDNNKKIPSEFKIFLEWKSIVVDAFSSLESKAVLFVKPSTVSLGVVMDRTDGKSWAQISGKIFGTIIDEWVIGKIGHAYKAATYVGKIGKGITEGGAVWAVGKTDYSAASYFEKAFPVAIDVYSKIINDSDYAHSVWEGVKGVADTEQFMRYYRNVTFDQFMKDLKDLFVLTNT